VNSLGHHESAVLIDLKQRAAEIRRRRRPMFDPHEERARTRLQVASMIVTVILMVTGWFVVQGLGKSAAMQECIMSGRINCMRADIQ